MSDSTFTFRVDKAHIKELSTAAHDVWFRRQVQIGQESANAGDLLSAAEVEDEAKAWRTETRQKMASNVTS